MKTKNGKHIKSDASTRRIRNPLKDWQCLGLCLGLRRLLGPSTAKLALDATTPHDAPEGKQAPESSESVDAALGDAPEPDGCPRRSQQPANVPLRALQRIARQHEIKCNEMLKISLPRRAHHCSSHASHFNNNYNDISLLVAHMTLPSLLASCCTVVVLRRQRIEWFYYVFA